VATFSLLTSAATALAADGWVLWRHYVPVNTPEIDDSLMLAGPAWDQDPKAVRNRAVAFC
jgi:hypothetical protein